MKGGYRGDESAERGTHTAVLYVRVREGWAERATHTPTSASEVHCPARREPLDPRPLPPGARCPSLALAPQRQHPARATHSLLQCSAASSGLVATSESEERAEAGLLGCQLQALHQWSAAAEGSAGEQ